MYLAVTLFISKKLVLFIFSIWNSRYEKKIQNNEHGKNMWVFKAMKKIEIWKICNKMECWKKKMLGKRKGDLISDGKNGA